MSGARRYDLGIPAQFLTRQILNGEAPAMKILALLDLARQWPDAVAGEPAEV